ncbi:c-type cytochrome [uncultured Roseobacter sp.]|uniref:c-type cytochrome n=1 Tax=uncultured Roseobacter sp. TaxID=114847 RepID=UPI0026274E1C|nr:c-type cytochrome [uncultured Roseobacter sp.]
MRRLTFPVPGLILVLAACGPGERDLEREGAALFAASCALCHGGDARGGGGAGVRGLSKTPADLTVLSRSAGGEFPDARVLGILEAYATGEQDGRAMTPLVALEDPRRARLPGVARVPRAQAAILAWLRSVQVP